MTYELFEGASGLDRVRDAWESLESRSPARVFQTYSFCRRWFDIVGAPTGSTPLVVVFSENGAPEALFPACLVPYGPVRLLTWLGGPLIMGSGDILWSGSATAVDAGAFMGSALTLLRRRARWAPLYLCNVHDEAVSYPWLTSQARVYKRAVAPYVTLGCTFDEYYAALSRDVRRSVERRWRRLSEQGTVAFEMLDPGSPACEEAARMLVDLSRMRHASRADGDDVLGERYGALRIAQGCSGDNAGLARLTLDGRTIAVQLYYLYRSRMDLAIFAYDAAFSAFSPGKLLLRCLAEECCRRDVGVLDLGEGADPYKYDWAQGHAALVTFTSSDLLGRMLCYAGNRSRKGTRASAS